MEPKSTKKESEKAHSREATADDLDLRLDDLEHEIIDLVEVVEEEGSSSGAARAEDLEVADDLVSDDLELEEDASEEIEAGRAGASEAEMQEADEALGEAEDEFESLLRADRSELEAEPEDLSAVSDDFGEEETDRELADLFASDELEVSKLLKDGSPDNDEGPTPVKGEGSVPDEEFLQGLFDDLEVEEDGAEAVGASSEEAPTKEDASADLLVELGLEPEPTAKAAAPQAPAPVEELPEDLFADLEKTGREAPEVPEADAVPLAAPGWNAEELAALVREQVEAVVTRLVEERLPAIAEAILMEEIRKIKAAME
ncbi:MAG TPA: hypothetical protein VMU60_02070 [Syntrophobacteria bacterium]|nr:hypothetical protein [Syntrophobacteria bacterium]